MFEIIWGKKMYPMGNFTKAAIKSNWKIKATDKIVV